MTVFFESHHACKQLVGCQHTPQQSDCAAWHVRHLQHLQFWGKGGSIHVHCDARNLSAVECCHHHVRVTVSLSGGLHV